MKGDRVIEKNKIKKWDIGTARVITEDFTEEVIFELRLEGGEDISLGHVGGKHSRQREHSLCRDRSMAGMFEEQ